MTNALHKFKNPHIFLVYSQVNIDPELDFYYTNQLNYDYKIPVLFRKYNFDEKITSASLYNAISEGAVRRIRPVMMTAATIILGSLPVLYSSGTGSEVMSRIAAPMVGGMISALLLTLLVLPCLYLLWQRRYLNN